MKTPVEEFKRRAPAQISLTPHDAVVTIDGEDYKIEYEGIGGMENITPENYSKPDFKPSIEDYMPTGVMIYVETLTSLSGKEIGEQDKQAVINSLSDYFKSDNLDVKLV